MTAFSLCLTSERPYVGTDPGAADDWGRPGRSLVDKVGTLDGPAVGGSGVCERVKEADEGLGLCPADLTANGSVTTR
jgi:hypothetical protein